MSLTALYATRSRDDIVTGFDRQLRRVQVERLISLMPSVDSLLPMLRSFEGMVDCTIAATAAVDTMMNIELPTLNAACSIRGENLVLLDGETFTEISKMLRFKNRERNLIDRISVDLLVHDNRIELFPFIVEMDRYKAAVSGVQRLDMSFDYHISVLKSPIPFRLGVKDFRYARQVQVPDRARALQERESPVVRRSDRYYPRELASYDYRYFPPGCRCRFARRDADRSDRRFFGHLPPTSDSPVPTA